MAIAERRACCQTGNAETASRPRRLPIPYLTPARAVTALGVLGTALLLLGGWLTVGEAGLVAPDGRSNELIPPERPSVAATLPPLRLVVVPAPVPVSTLPDTSSAPAPPAPPPPPPPRVAPKPPVMDHLPGWVQTRHPAALMSGPDAAAIRFTMLPPWSFLKVTGFEADRLRVEYAGDGGLRRAGPGWVKLDDVQPSDPSGVWLQAHRASQLFEASAGGKSQSDVPQWSSLLTLEATAGDRVRVRVYSADYTRVLGEGWIAAGDVGPVGPPERAVFTQTLPAPPAPLGDHDAFITALGQAAYASQGATGVPASVTVAQAILESNWGESLLTRLANNYFGIKAIGQLGNDGVVWMRTREYDANGAAYVTQAPFRAYKTVLDSVADHTRLFVQGSLYRAAMQATSDPDEFAQRIAAAGYSTDPSYSAKLIGLMVKYDLYRFDHAP